uniref:Beta-ketoacyl-[acyl-carrier-protein] synthase III n=1 Tax=Porphyridium sordidum TaxID=28024 RepID=A0A1C9CDU2_PORSO|nr:3-oxoacyl-acyl-carrier-protein synthase 3 [Porphyridium sordidum]AOM66514.1 3-oxoacyl-acyl-carrier-protein synthase 3 [Porphyridium sordidum]
MNFIHKNGVQIISTGSCLPKVKVSNKDLSYIVGTSDDWITTRTGIQERRVISQDESLLSLSCEASLIAIKRAKLIPSDLDLIILATSTADDLFGTASKIQAEIEANNAAAFDITAACSGFLIAFITASQFLMTGAYKNILIVGADTLSKWVDWSDRKTCILFGDGAGAMIIQASNQYNNLIDFDIKTNGKKNHFLNINSLQNSTGITLSDLSMNKMSYDYISMNGQEVYKFAISQIPEIISNCLKSNKLTTDEVDWLLLHQANERILKTISEKLNISQSKVLKNLNLYGNTSAASIPIMLDEAISSKLIKTGDLIVMSGFGAGLTWGVALIRWQ